jgi:hypothetical protein
MTVYKKCGSLLKISLKFLGPLVAPYFLPLLTSPEYHVYATNGHVISQTGHQESEELFDFGRAPSGPNIEYI